jgi:hypothetical protein
LGLYFFCSIGCSEALAAAHIVKFLHIAANEGNSSGGHAAICFDNETFHFQHDPAGIIRLQRLGSRAFDHVYAVLGNRPIHESWIEVSADTYAQLLDGFTQALLIQDAQLRTLASLQSDVALFELLLEHQQNSGTPPQLAAFPLKGSGYFAAADLKAESDSTAWHNRPVSQNISSLKARIGDVYGENFIALRLHEAEAAIGSLKLQADTVSTESLAAERYPAYIPSASAVYADAQLALAALRLVQSTPQLVPGSYWLPMGDSWRLSPAESRFLRSYAEKLTGYLLRLVNSTRSDWGFPFIVGMARLAALEASLSTGQLVFLDIFPAAPRQADQHVPGDRRYLPAMKEEAERHFQQKREKLFNGTELREADLAALELLGNKLMEIEYSLAHDVHPRHLPEVPVPARPALLTALSPAMNLAELQHELAAARVAANDYAAAIENLYEYDLFQRNCVTEIFSAINRFMASAAAVNSKTAQSSPLATAEAVKAESHHRLGGYIDPLHGLNFIPALSSETVDSSYRVTAHRELPSYRSTQLAAMKKREAAPLVFLRESNTITSTIYRRNPHDSAFLFFTDDTFFLRPVFGAFNLLAGLGESFFGLAAMPVEGGNRLYQGAKGVLFSLPELVFINLRKGTMEYVAEVGQTVISARD